MDAASAASTCVLRKTSLKCSGAPAPDEAITGIETAALSIAMSGRSKPACCPASGARRGGRGRGKGRVDRGEGGGEGGEGEEGRGDAVAVDAVDEQLAGPERLHRARHLHDVEPRPLAAALQRALVPAERLAGGTASAAAERTRVVGERVPLCGGGVRHPHAARVDRDDARLRAVLCGDGLDRGRAVARASALEVRAGSLRRVGAEGDLVRAGAEVGVGDLQRGRA